MGGVKRIGMRTSLKMCYKITGVGDFGGRRFLAYIYSKEKALLYRRAAQGLGLTKVYIKKLKG